MPGVALLRDSHRFLGPAVLMLLPGFAAAVRWLAEQRRPGREAMWSCSRAWWRCCRPAAAEPGLGTRRQAGSVVVPGRVGHGGRDPRVRGRRPDHRAAVVRELPRVRVEPGPGGSGPGTSLPARPGVDRRLTGPRRHRLVPPESDDVAAAAGARVGGPGGWAPRAGHPVGARGEGHGGGRVPPGEVVHSGPGLDLVDLGRAAEVDGTGPPPSRWPQTGWSSAARCGDGRVVRRLRTPVAGLARGHRLGTGTPDVSLLVSTCMLPPPDRAWEGPS